jgi:hypothetical protein
MLKSRSHLGPILAAVSVTAVALTAPAASPAATTIGQLDPFNPADEQGAPECVAGRVYTQGSTNGDGNVTYDLPTTPSVITAWATTNRFPGRQGALKVVGNNGNGTFTVLATSAVQTLAVNEAPAVNRFSARIPVPGGGQLAWAPVGNGAQRCYFNPLSVADNTDNVVAHGLSSGDVGTTWTVDTQPAERRMSLEATFEADSDADGWGDESQDRCPGVAGGNQGCVAPPLPPPDVTKPVLGSLTFSRTTFAAAKSGAAFGAQKGRKKQHAVGTKVSFTLTEASSVKFTVQRKTSGRRVKGKCRTRNRLNRKKAKCTLWKSVRGSFTVQGKAGKNSFTFRGRMGGKSLKPGSYRLNGTAIDPAKNSSAPGKKGFRIVK